MESPRYSVTQAVPVSPTRISFIGDVYNGTVRGDFAARLGWAGRIAQIICAFIPGIGTICALRDFIADRRKHDNVGAFLNFLGLIPFLGAFPKTAAVLRSVRHVGSAVHAVSRVQRQQNTPVA